MDSDSVHPLRIAKGAPSGSPTKVASSVPRPLSEISPSEKRRNSPSWKQMSARNHKASLNTDSSPFQSSPAETLASPRLFWQNRNTENKLYAGGADSPSPHRRPSVERLQKASRVKNSNILALEQKQEYDPTRIPQIERPLSKVQDGYFASAGSMGLRSPTSERQSFEASWGPSKNAMSPSETDFTPREDTPEATEPAQVQAPSRPSASPSKSSLSPSKFKSSFDLDMAAWSANSSFVDQEMPPHGRILHRHAKSVTFDAAPPQINEYEMATPDLSSIGTNSREGSYESMEDDEEDSVLYDPAGVELGEDSFDASLEDTDKTPVVGPEDWRGHSPMVGHGRASFDGSPAPEGALSMATAGRPSTQRNNSTHSSGEHRPLPPLPGMGQSASHSTSSMPAPPSPAMSATAERIMSANRYLPVPPPASANKADLQNIGNGKMTLEERLTLMMQSDDAGVKSAAEQQRERRMRRGNGRERVGSPSSEVDSILNQDPMEAYEEEDAVGDISALEDYQLPPRISRESIMRRVNGNKVFERESDYNFSSPPPSSSPQRSPTRSPERLVPLDPDVPIPSTEDSILMEDPNEDDDDDDDEGSVIITRQPEDDMSDDTLSIDGDDVQRRVSDGPSSYDDEDSLYSDQPTPQGLDTKEMAEETGPSDTSAPTEPMSTESSLPNLDSGRKESSLSMGLESYMLPKPEDPYQLTGPMSDLGLEDEALEVEAETMSRAESKRHSMADAQAYLQRPYTPEQSMSKPEYDGSGWGEPEDESENEEPGTPESVIRHPVSDEEESARDSPAIPEQVATIKASGSKLKTRVSGTPSDLAAMREARRHVSHEVPSVPTIPARHRNRLSRGAEPEQVDPAEADDFLERHPSFKKSSLTLDLDLGLSLDQDFDRVIEAQKVDNFSFNSRPKPPTQRLSLRASNQSLQAKNKMTFNANVPTTPQRGYLMRQNTKLVAASDKEGDESWKARSAGNSPIKTERPQSWTVEPWEAKGRQRNARKRPETIGAVPPLPGFESNAAVLPQVAEEDPNSEIAHPDTGERGRLFVKVLGVKDLDLPIPKNERSWFSLTLDNGVHCVTTAWLELARNAPIGQEFELVVPNDLEFQLTLNVKLEKPAPVRAPVVAKPTKPKTSTFSRVFASPKKRKEMELRQREEEERAVRQQEATARRMKGPPSAYELLSPLAAEDGSFGRSYVCLKEHESRCFGRPYMTEVACFNEWATEEAGFASSVKSKRGDTANLSVVRRAPYKVGKLELQLLFVPRPKTATDDEMPKSMNSCIRELKAAEERMTQKWEGHLSQQGGDCPYWRRRYFKLAGTKLTAYHEATRQARATINLANAKRLIDDRRSLTEKETTGRNGRRRRSAFAEEEEGYMFVEEGFRIRFNNGEVIDFYADTREDKETWMQVLSEVIGRGDGGPDEDASGTRTRAKWCELVLKREEHMRRRASGRRVHSRTKSTYN